MRTCGGCGPRTGVRGATSAARAVVYGRGVDEPRSVLVVTGAAATGKSTVGDHLRGRRGLVVVDGDVLGRGAAATAGGRFQRVLAVAWEKQAEGNAQWGLGGGKSGSMGAGGIFAPWVRAYISRSGAPEHIGWKVAVKDRLNAVKNPYAHLKLPDITIEKVRDSMIGSMARSLPLTRMAPRSTHAPRASSAEMTARTCSALTGPSERSRRSIARGLATPLAS